MNREDRFGAALGAHPEPGGTRFRVFSSRARQCAVRLFGADQQALATHTLEPRGEGHFELFVPELGHGTLYKFVLDERELPDPYARFLPYGVHGPALVVEPRYTPRFAAAPVRPLAEQILYELHIGAFTREGTYRAAALRLPALRELGITTLELMPLSSFAGQRGWGYDGVMHFAPFAPYGTPDELRTFVDTAHGLGLSVLLDVVYNHFGPAGNYLAAYAPEYFTREVQNLWGEALNLAHPAMRAYVLDNARYWLTSFGFDGLRLDAVHTISDPSSPHILEELVQQVRTLEPKKFLIAEDERNDPELIQRVGLDAVWADDFHHQLRVTLTGERDGYYAAYAPGAADLAQTIQRGFLYDGRLSPFSGKPRGKPAHTLAAESFVYCIQNHDQIGNRALGTRLSADVSLDAYCTASALLLFLPMTPLLFMGQEWAATTPFLYFTDHEPELGRAVSRGRREEFKSFRAFADPAMRETIPDPQAPETFERSRLDWNERTQPYQARVLALYQQLCALRRDDPVLRRAPRSQLEARAEGEVLVVRRWDASAQRILLANLGSDAVDFGRLGLPAGAALVLGNPKELATLPAFGFAIAAAPLAPEALT